MLGGAGAVRRRAASFRATARAPPRLRGVWLLGAFALLAVFTALSISWSLTPGGLVAGDQPHARLPRRVRRRARARPARARALGRAAGRRSALGAVLLCVLGAADQGLPARAGARRDVRAPARAVRLLEQRRADGRARRSRRCCGSPRAAPATRRVNALAWPALGILHRVPDALLLARRAGRARRRARRCGSRSCRCGCARSPRSAGAMRRPRVPLVAWAFAQDGLTTDRAPMAVARRRRPRASARCCCC